MSSTSNEQLFIQLEIQKGQGNDPNTAVNNLKEEFATATVEEWAEAVHLAWLDTSTTLKEEIEAIGQITAFTNEEVTTAVTLYFLEIEIAVDTTTILGKHNNNGNESPIYVGNCVSMTSNHQAETSGQGSHELVAKDLQPNESIFWTAAASDSNSGDTVQLVAFLPSRPEESYSEMIAEPQQVPGNTNQFFTHVLSDPTLHITYVYLFHFTINNGSQVYTFDPYLED